MLSRNFLGKRGLILSGSKHLLISAEAQALRSKF